MTNSSPSTELIPDPSADRIAILRDLADDLVADLIKLTTELADIADELRFRRMEGLTFSARFPSIPCMCSEILKVNSAFTALAHVTVDMERQSQKSLALARNGGEDAGQSGGSPAASLPSDARARPRRDFDEFDWG